MRAARPVASPAVPLLDEGRGLISLLDFDPELGSGLSPDERSIARRLAVGTSRRLNGGAWDPGDLHDTMLLVVNGLLVRRLRLGDRLAAELLGPEDVLGGDGPEGDLLPGHVTWRVLSRQAQVVAVPQERLRELPAPVVAALLRRTMQRGARLATAQAIAQLPAVEDRVVALFAHLGERWGQVTPRGVKLPLPLTHAMIGQLLGAARPTVSLALKNLAAERSVVPCATTTSNRTWPSRRSSSRPPRAARARSSSGARAGRRAVPRADLRQGPSHGHPACAAGRRSTAAPPGREAPVSEHQLDVGREAGSVSRPARLRLRAHEPSHTR